MDATRSAPGSPDSPGSPGSPGFPGAPDSPGSRGHAAPDSTVPDLDVTALPPLEHVLEQLTEPLSAWMPAQRWYAHKGAGAPRVALHGWAPLRIAPDHAVLLTVVAVTTEDSAATEVLYQVPLVLRRPDAPSGPRDEGSEVGVIAVPGGPLRIDDAARDADGRAALLATLISGDGTAGPGLALSSRRTRPDAPLPVGRTLRSSVLTGEQSNTSLILETEGATPLIVKLFRVLQDGQNPDVVLQSALTAAGSARVPAVVGSAMVRTGAVRTHALVSQEYLAGVEDAWRVAMRRAVAGEGFDEAARALGTAVAEVHRDLAEVLGTTAADEQVVASVVAQMRRRGARTAAQVPQVAEHLEALDALLDAALEVPWPALQRIHGDLHLGQVLLAPGRGWVLVDFEGEPLRPLAERGLPDSPLRDVAGMLRSLDYVAGAVALEHGTDVSAWTMAAREAFLDGYAAATADLAGEAGAGAAAAGGVVDRTAMRVLLGAFEADKAVYEALYEARNRPRWLPIPLAALARISARGAGAGSGG